MIFLKHFEILLVQGPIHLSLCVTEEFVRVQVQHKCQVSFSAPSQEWIRMCNYISFLLKSVYLCFVFLCICVFVYLCIFAILFCCSSSCHLLTQERLTSNSSVAFDHQILIVIIKYHQKSIESEKN